jgi:hypothetical protein
MKTLLLAGIWLSFVWAAPWHQAFAAEPADVATAAEWPLEQIRLSNGRVYRGLIEAQDAGHVRFLQIQRPKGRWMYAIGLSIPRATIAEIVPLSLAEHQVLEGRVRQFRDRDRLEADMMADLKLAAFQRDGRPCWSYRGERFQLESTADEEITRRSIVRIEQVFAAYQAMLPPRTAPRQPLKILVFGAMAEYRGYLEGMTLKVANPAVYLADRNVIASGSDLAALAAQVSKTRQHHAALRDELKRREDEYRRQLREESRRLKQEGRSSTQIKEAMLLAGKRFDTEAQQLRRTMNKFDQANASLFDGVTRQMFARLYHEGLHAYLEDFVYPRPEHDVPRWFNEGLAQVFEDGFLEVGTWRVDSPRRDLLTRLQTDLRSANRLALAEVISAEPRAFLVEPASRAELAARYYLYAWGLAWYLTSEEPVLGASALDAYVGPAAKTLPPVVRFEKLVGAPLPEFERRWREYVLSRQAK